MPRLAIAFLGAGILTIFTATTAQQGLQDLIRANTKWTYSPFRDMRRTVAFTPQKVAMLSPDPASVPVGGIDVAGEDPPYEKNLLRKNPVPTSDSSVARGGRIAGSLCAPCHGKILAGDGPVAAKFMPPPDLLAEATRNRTDGFLYSYIRFGGVVMPSYGAQLTAQQAWDVVNYLRHQQRTAPR